MKNSHYRDQKMEAYCDEVRRLEDKFMGWSSTMLLDGTKKPQMSWRK
jgi:hypothetical protein